MNHQNTVLAATAAGLGIGYACRGFAASPAAAVIEQAPAVAEPTSLPGRTAHWVIRCADLKPFLEFASACFGMKVIRHEENSEPCDITCNGRYNSAWSKTMVGYNDEAFAYCLEVAYNYGVYEYDKGNALLSIGIAVPDVAATLNTAKTMGYAVEVPAPPPPSARAYFFFCIFSRGTAGCPGQHDRGA